MPKPAEKLALAEKHLARVLEAWEEPDWADLSLYGFYALEAAVDAAALEHGIEVRKRHWARVETARELYEGFGLPDVSMLLRDLNEVRKSEAYGEVAAPELDPEKTAMEIESYVEAVAAIVDRQE